jgi:hypothetical protein
VEAALLERESAFSRCPLGRLFYLALPPSVYAEVVAGIKAYVTRLSDEADNPKCVAGSGAGTLGRHRRGLTCDLKCGSGITGRQSRETWM